MQIIPAIDLERGRSRVVYWPGASTGIGAPTDRPERIAEQFVARGARLIHLVDFDGAKRPAGEPRGRGCDRGAGRGAHPVGGRSETADGIRLAFAAGATRVVTSIAIVDDRPDSAEALEVAGLARRRHRPEAGADRRLSVAARRDADPGRRRRGAGRSGVTRLVLAHGGQAPDPAILGPIAARGDIDVLVAGGATDLDGIRRLRDAGIAASSSGRPCSPGRSTFPRPWRPPHDPRAGRSPMTRVTIATEKGDIDADLFTDASAEDEPRTSSTSPTRASTTTSSSTASSPGS